MANTMTGILVSKGETVDMPYSNGTKFIKKRKFVLDCSTYNRLTGEKYENFVQFDLTGERDCAIIAPFGKDARVTVSFYVDGWRYEKDGETRYSHTLRAYDIKPYEQGRTQVPTQDTPPTQQQAPQGTSQAPQEQDDDLPF